MFKRLFDTSSYKSETDQYRARVLYIAVILLVIFYAFYALVIAEWVDRSNPDGALTTLANIILHNPTSQVAFMFYAVYLAAFAIYILNRSGYVRIASWALVGVWYVSGVLLTITTTPFPAYAGMSIMVLLVLAAMLTSDVGILVTLVVSLVTLLVRVAEGDLRGDAQTAMFNAMLITTNGALLLYFFLHIARLNRAEGMSAVVGDQLVATQVLTQIARRVSQRVGLKTLLNEVVDAINERYASIYHTQVFLIDANGLEAQLVASTGQIGMRLLESGHSLNVGSDSVIGQVTLHGSPVVALAGVQGTIHRRNLLLPETRVEAAFPLRIGDEIIGALDVQSKRADSFRDDNILTVFQALADSIALAIDNVRQYELAETRVQDNQRLVEEMRLTLREVERLNERLTGRAWSEYLQRRDGNIGLDLDFESNAVQSSGEMTPTLQDAVRINQFVQQQADGRQVVAFPLRVRGRVIGAMEFELDGDGAFSPQDFDVIQEVSERFGLAVENARLVDVSQRVAQREALVNQISTRLQTTNNVESMLNEAARSLQTTLKAHRVAIRLGTPPANGQNGHDGHKGS